MTGSRLISEDEFLALPESVQKTELVCGELVVSPAPNRRHQRVVVRLVHILEAWAETRRPAEIGTAPQDLRLGPDRIVQPDVAVWLGGVDIEATVITRIPDLVVEVISSDRVYDRVTKRLLYGDAGVPEYWVVDPLARRVERFAGPRLNETLRLEGEARLQSRVLPGVALDLAELFER